MKEQETKTVFERLKAKRARTRAAVKMFRATSGLRTMSDIELMDVGLSRLGLDMHACGASCDAQTAWASDYSGISRM